MNRDNFCQTCGGTGRKLKDGDICPNCNATVTYGHGKKRKVIVVKGTDHKEVSSVATKLMEKHDTPPLLSLITHWSFWFGVLLALLGVVLVIVGATGETDFVFFGQSFKSQNVAIASCFLGAVLVVLNVRRVLKSLDRRN